MKFPVKVCLLWVTDKCEIRALYASSILQRNYHIHYPEANDISSSVSSYLRVIVGRPSKGTRAYNPGLLFGVPKRRFHFETFVNFNHFNRRIIC